MKARQIILTIATAVLLAAPTAVLAQTGPGPGDGSGPGSGWGSGSGHHGGGQGWLGGDEGGNQLRFFERMLPRLAEELGLSDEQLERIQAIVDAARPEINRLSQLLQDGREAYRAENNDPTIFDEGAFQTHATAQHAIQIELGVLVGRTKAEAFNVLTPEQIEQLGEMRGNFGMGKARRGGSRRSTS